MEEQGNKGISSGYIPLGGIATKKEIVDVIKVKSGDGDFSYGHTFTNHPVSAAVGAAVLDYINKHDLVEKCAKRGEYLFHKLNELKEFSFVGDVRGKGLMAGIEFVKDKATKEPFSRKLKITEKVIDQLFESGLVVYPAKGFVNGIDGDAIMVAPPLIVEEKKYNIVRNPNCKCGDESFFISSICFFFNENIKLYKILKPYIKL